MEYQTEYRVVGYMTDADGTEQEHVLRTVPERALAEHVVEHLAIDGNGDPSMRTKYERVEIQERQFSVWT